MPSFELLEFLALVLVLCPFAFSYYILKRRKDMFPLLPGATFLVLSFLCTNLEAFAAPEEFNFLEHLFIMLMGISFLIGISYMYFKKSSKKAIEIKEKKRW